MIDRLAPCVRPEIPCVGSQKWRELLFIHWPIAVEQLRPLVPAPLEIDTFEGTAYIGIVPFQMKDVRPSWLPSVCAFNFLETNLRTYVHINGEPGVFFFSLEAESWLAVQAARIGWRLPYFHSDMRMDKKGQNVEYECLRKGSKRPYFRAHYTIGEALGESRPETLEHFLLERYLLFTQKGRKLLRGQVYHTPYPAYAAHPYDVREELIAAAGLPATQGPPTLAHYSPGVDVEIFALQALDAVRID